MAASEQCGLHYFVNAFWTAGQRRGPSLHEISYRVCFKSQLPAFFIDRVTDPGDRVYGPVFRPRHDGGAGGIDGPGAAANDFNPLSAMLSALARPSAAVRLRLAGILSLALDGPADADLLAFYHSETLRPISSFNARGFWPAAGRWIQSMRGSGWWRSTD